MDRDLWEGSGEWLDMREWMAVGVNEGENLTC